MNGYEYNALKALCRNCGQSFEVFDLFANVLQTKNDSNLWSFPFAIIAEFNLAEVFEDLIDDEELRIFPYERIEIDFKKYGLTDDAQIIYLNISLQVPDEKFPVLMLSQIRGNEMLSISDIPLVLRYLPLPATPIPELQLDRTRYATAGILLRWHKKSRNSIVEDHVIKAALSYWKSDLNQMVYNCFSAFELYLSNLVEDFWKRFKNLSDQEYKAFFDRGSVEKRIRLHLPLMCRELSLTYDDSMKDKINLIHQLREQRNAVVHEGTLNASKETEKAKLFAAFSWGMLLLHEVRTKFYLI